MAAVQKQFYIDDFQMQFKDLHPAAAGMEYGLFQAAQAGQDLKIVVGDGPEHCTAGTGPKQARLTEAGWAQYRADLEATGRLNHHSVAAGKGHRLIHDKAAQEAIAAVIEQVIIVTSLRRQSFVKLFRERTHNRPSVSRMT
jgi:hypothetical protein